MYSLVCNNTGSHSPFSS